MGLSAGEMDRRITVEQAIKTVDAANDEVIVWQPWPNRRWASKRNMTGTEMLAAQQMVRQADTIWVLRYDSQSLQIAPESHRIMHDGAIYEIVAILEDSGRHEGLKLLTSSRPDHQGARGKGIVSEGAP